jgi:hypothetical protein
MSKRIIAAGISGVFGWLIIYPLDVVKNRMQAQPVVEGGKVYKSTWDCILKSYKAEGWQVFFRGLQFTLLRAAPVSAILLPIYDTAHHFFIRYVKNPNETDLDMI